jgi:hypothetical protein
MKLIFIVYGISAFLGISAQAKQAADENGCRWRHETGFVPWNQLAAPLLGRGGGL